MSQFVICPRATDEFDERTRGYVLANRINDVVAKPSSKRFREYLHLIQEQFSGEPVVDHNDQYREKVREVAEYALSAYERRHEVDVHIDRLYFHEDDIIKIAAAPDAIEDGLCGLTAHIRQSEDSYEQAVEVGVTKEMERHAQAMMLITKQPAWIHLNYWHDLNTRQRRLFEHEVRFDARHADELEDAMMAFLLKARRRAVA